MPESAAARALRLLDLVPYLTAHPGTTVAEVANAFDVSRAEILKDLNLLFLCGLPGYTALELIDISFDDEIINVRDPQNLSQPRRLTERESLALRIALQALEDSLPQQHDQRSRVSSLRTKLRSAFSREIPEGSILLQGSFERIVLDNLHGAMSKHLKVQITYENRTKDEVRARTIHPLAIDIRENRPMLKAWCELSKGIRTFRISQIREIQVLDEVFQPDEAESGTDSFNVVLRVLPDSAFSVENRNSLRARDDGNFEILVFDEEWMIRMAIAYIDEIEVLEPEFLRGAIRGRIHEALA